MATRPTISQPSEPPPQPVAPAPAPAPAPAAAGPQTGVTGQVIQVEHVGYRGEVSRIGVATLVYALALIIGAFAANGLIGTFNDAWSLGLEIEPIFIILPVSFLIPAMIALWLSRNRVRALLVENPANIEDVFFKRYLRRSFELGVSNSQLIISSIVDGVVWVAISGLVTWILWNYQKTTKR